MWQYREWFAIKTISKSLTSENNPCNPSSWQPFFHYGYKWCKCVSSGREGCPGVHRSDHHLSSRFSNRIQNRVPLSPVPGGGDAGDDDRASLFASKTAATTYCRPEIHLRRIEEPIYLRQSLRTTNGRRRCHGFMLSWQWTQESCRRYR